MRIALLEDDVEQARLLEHWLNGTGHTLTHRDRGKDFLRIVLRESFDLLILDWEVPDLSGIEVLTRIRESQRDFTPVLFVTVRDEEAAVVKALQIGADDYMAKPLRRLELLARINALGRRGTTGHGSDELPDTAPFEFDLERKLLQRAGVDVSLTHREFELACFMFQKVGRVVSRGHILESIWGMHDGDVSTRTVDTHMSRLRKKLDLDDAGWTLTAVYQHGYRLEGPVDGESDRNEED